MDMDYSSLKEAYEKRNYDDYRLRTIEDIEDIYGLNIKSIKGYGLLSDRKRRQFQQFIINYYNTQGLIY